MSSPETPGASGLPSPDNSDSTASGGFFAELAKLGHGEATPPLPPVDAFPGYTIVRVLSHGGQGVVYQAIQQATKQKVAIKVLLEGPYASPAARKRFEREIELVAQLKHANIVSVFHAGQTADGRQFYVMEYVRGTPLIAYVREKKLPLEEALRLFTRVCDAIQYAHQRGIIHRDLKPTNILVDAAGEPKVLDFGLAKWLAAPAGSVSVSQQVMGTLPYMSPEQARGNPDEIDTRTDIYALGVILYEMLTGGYPYPVAGQMALVLRYIAEEEPTPPSRKWSRDSGIAQRSSGRLRAGRCPIDDEVQTIVLKSLAKERQRRYQSAGELARDLEHYLAGEPIEARRDSAFYLLRKQLRRHKGPLAGATLLMLVLAAWAASMSFLAVEKDKLARRADEKAAEAVDARQAALVALQQVQASDAEARKQRDSALLEKQAADEARGQAADKAREADEQRAWTEQLLQRFDEQNQELDAARTRAERNALEANDQRLQTEQLLQRYDEQNKELDAARIRAERNAREAQDEADRSAAVRDFIESAVAFANTNVEANQRAFAAALHTATEESARRLAQQPALEVAVNNLLARAYAELHKYDEQKSHAERAMELAERHLGPTHPETIAALCNMARMSQDHGDYPEAERLIRQAYRAAESGEIAATNPDRLRAELLYAELVGEQGRTEESSAVSGRVLDVCRELFGMRNIQTLEALPGLVSGGDFSRLGLFNAFDLRNARNVSRSLLGEDNRQTIMLTLLALLPRVEEFSAKGKVSEDTLRELEETTARTFAHAKRALGWSDPITLMAAGAYVAALYAHGKTFQAILVFIWEIPRDIGERLARSEDPEAVGLLSGGGYALVALGEYLGPGFRKKGLRWQRNGVALADEHLPSWHKLRIESRESYAEGLAVTKQWPAACAMWEEAATIAQTNDRVTDYLRVLGELAERGCLKDKPVEAEPRLVEALQHIDEVESGKRDDLQLRLCRELGTVYVRNGKMEAAEQEYQLAMEIADRLKRHDDRIDTRLLLGSLYRSQHRCPEARAMLLAAQQIATHGKNAIQKRDIEQRLAALAGECADEQSEDLP